MLRAQVVRHMPLTDADWIGDYAQLSDEFNMGVTDEDLEDAEPDPEIDADELEMTQEELRPRVERALTLNIGVSIPWQQYGLSYETKASDYSMNLYSIGGGHNNFSGMEQEGSYEISVNYRSFVYGWRLFLSDLIPVFVEPSIGFGLWEGRINPDGSDGTNTTAASKLDAGFSTGGPIVGASLGVAWYSGSRWFIEYYLFNVGKAILTQERFTDTVATTRAIVRDNIERAMSWGLVNIRVGYMF